MPKEIYMYEPLYSFTAADVVRAIEEVSSEDFSIRIDCPGGQVSSGWSIISKLSELSQKKTAIVDGAANSMAAISLLFFDKVIVNDTSEVMFHKAAYPEWYKPTTEEAQRLKEINAKFREKLEAIDKCPQELIDKIFEPEIRRDVYVSPDDCVAYGIASEKRTLDVTQKQAYRRKAVALAYKQIDENNSSKNDNKVMTLKELRAQHPSVYEEIVKEGAEAEKKRVASFLKHIKVEENSCAARAIKAIGDGESYLDAMPDLNVLALAEMQSGLRQEENLPEVGADDTPPEQEEETSVEPTAQEAEKLVDGENFDEAGYKRTMAMVSGYSKTE